MFQSQPIRRSIAFLATASIGLAFTGCRQQVYHELYAEQNAREIRALEDRIYEYDHEYRALEYQLAVLSEKNEELERQLAEGRGSRTQRKESSPPPSTTPNLDMEYELPSILIPSPDNAPNSDQGPSFSLTPKGEKSAPAGDATKPPSSAPKANNLPNLPNSPEKNSAPDKNAVPNPFPGGSVEPLPEPKKGGLEPLQPPPLGGVRDRDQSDIRSSRIVIPEVEAVQPTVQMASAEEPVESSDSKRVIDLSNQPSKVTDRRIVDIVFHPSLCRGNNLDEEPGDDGLYLVLQSVNNQGELVIEPVKITIVASDPASSEEDQRIALWTIGPQEAQKALQMQGRSQGYHFPLRWQSLEPTGDRVHVMVRFEFTNGKTVVGQHDIVLHRKDSLRSVWTPRSENRRR